MDHDKSHHTARWGTFMVALSALVAITGLGHIQATLQAPPALPGMRPLPQALIFEQNPAQDRERAPFRARGADYDIRFSAAGARLSLRGQQLAIRPLGARQDARPAPHRPLATRHHYLLGDDPAAWHTDVPTYGELRYRQLYPGIDLVYYGREGRLEYDFVIAPQADPGLIRLAFEGADHIAVNERGELLLQVGDRQLVQPPPHIYQELADSTQAVAGGYHVNGKGEVGFRLAAYDRQRPLIIDPVLVYASYLGGAADERTTALAVDASGNIYLAGSTDSADLASGAAFDSSCGSDGDCNSETLADIGATVRKSDIFVTKLAPDGSVIYTTYLGGSRADQATDLAVNTAGEVYVSGYTQATDYPVTAGAFDSACSDVLPTPGGDGICDEGTEAVITRLAADGAALIYSTYLGGDGDDFAHALALDGAGNAYVTGSTASSDFPTVNPFAATFSGHQDVFVAKLNPAGSALVYATYLGGSASDVARDIAVDAAGSAYVTGYTSSQDFPVSAGALDTSCGASGLCDGLVDDDGDGNSSTITTFDAFVAKLDPAGNTLAYATYLGGERYDYGNAIAVDSAGRAYVAGETRSAAFPGAPFSGAYQGTIAGSYDGYVARLDAAGGALDFFTYLGGGSGDTITDLALDASGEIYVTGSTFSRDFPTRDPFASPPPQRQDNAVIVYNSEAFLAKFNADASTLRHASLFGGQHNDYGSALALGASGQAYFTGYSFSVDLPLSSDAVQSSHRNDTGDATVIASDSFIARIDDASGNLSVSLSDDTDPIDQGEEITYTAQVSNLGNTTAEGVIFSYDIPQDTDLVSVTSSQGSCSRNYNTIHCQLGRLAAAGGASIALVIKPRGAGEFQNTATVTALLSDSDGSDNSASETTTVTPPAFTPSSGGNGALNPLLLALWLGFAGIMGWLRRPIW